MSFDRAKTALATLEEKLRRQLGLAGLIGAGFEPALKPVLVTGDLREPGNAFYRGRHWSFGNSVAITAGNEFCSLRFEVDCIVLGVMFASATTGIARVYITAADASPAVAVATNCGVWTDRKRLTTDLVPLTGTFGAARTGANFSDANTVIGTNGGTVVLPLQMYMPANSALNWVGATAGNVSLTVWGRVAEQVG